MRRCVIVGGAEMKNIAAVKKYLREDDFFICCDCGLNHCEKLGIKPDLIVGDFDSSEKPDTDVETIVLPCEKDDTDTVYAVKEALSRGFSDFLFIGVFGGRFDHSIGNLSILLMLDSLGKRAVAADDFSEFEIVSGKPAEISDEFEFFSLLAMSEKVYGVCIKNAKYPLEDAEISCEFPYGISNEVLKGRTATVSVKRGRLLLVKVRPSV